MPDSNQTDEKELTEEEAAKLRDAALKRMLNTPPKPRTSKQEEREPEGPRRSS